jgi:Icc protein
LHLTDPHLFADTAGDLRGTVTYASLRAALDHYRHNEWRADIVISTGDLIQDDSAGAYRHFCELLGALALPVYCVPGNHDVRAVMQEVLADHQFNYCASIEHGNWLIASIDSCVDGKAGGHIAATELDRLDAEISRSGMPHVMVCLHHPPVQMGSKWLDSVGLTNADEFLARASASGNVKLALFGHVHQPCEAEHGGITILGTPSTCRQFTPRSDTFAVDDNPPAYRRVNLYADGRFEHELIWVNDEPVF